ncbi:protein phosphatase 1 regulatory subunit 14A [Emydura macquarii macquarii]|uniref:protein phosphatase 1 regulatory subunit 14A n=1 Tax=Emydura macquarii macquarii TaxID=1129001 RepID=UPI00352A7586
MAANRVGRRLGRGSPARSPGAGSPRREPARSPGIQKRQARVTVKYDRRELQRRLDTEKWVDGRLEELYRGREAEMPDEVNIDELLDLDTDEARAMQLRGILKSCQNNTQAFVQELLLKLRGLQKQQVLRRTSQEIQERV